jgi:type VI secretion system protein VasD
MFLKLNLTAITILTLIIVSACVPKPTTVSLNVTANAASNGGLPVKATIYYLTSTEKFKAADYFALESGANAVLGADVLESSSVLLSPGQTKQVSANFEAGGPTALGVIVGFKAIDSAQWQSTTSLKSGAENSLTIGIGAASVSISK